VEAIHMRIPVSDAVARMYTLRYPIFALLLVMWTDGSLVAQGNIITTVAGNGQRGFGGDGGPASEAMLNSSGSVAVDSNGNIYIADWRNQRIRKISTNGIITTVAGNGQRGFSGDQGPAIDASLDLINIGNGFSNNIDPNTGQPFPAAAGGIAVDAAGNLYIADTNNHRVRKVDLNGMITTVAGGGVGGSLSYPSGLALDRDGTIYIADPGDRAGNQPLLKVNPDGTISTVACCFWRPMGVALSGTGNIYVADAYFGYDGMIFKIDTLGNVQPLGGPRFSFTDTSWTNNPWASPWSLAVDRSGDVVVAEVAGVIGKVSPNNEGVSIVAGSADATSYYGCCGSSGYAGDGGPADRSLLASPYGVAVDGAGNIYIADTGNNRIRMIAPLNPTITLDSKRYCIGDPWTLGIASSVSDAWVQLFGTSVGRPWEITDWRKTGFNGSVIETGVFRLSDTGDHTLIVTIDGKASNSVSFSVSTCQVQ
jgi:sugar lactone lactonase YvrE